MEKHDIFKLIEDDLSAVESELYSVLKSPVGLITDIGNHLVQAGGKRLRPALCLLCAKASPNAASILPIAVAIEFIHMATLVHDDVIDMSAKRRGIATANACWGNKTSVLAGDYLFARAFALVAAYGNNQILQILSGIISTLCEGEIVQIAENYNPDVTENDYLLRINKKTADFIARSCEIGGIAANLSSNDVIALRNYGYAVGMAFQITDDILDFTASEMQIGKPVGHDLREGVVTLPTIYALKYSSAKEELREIILSKDASDANIIRALHIVHESGAIEYCYGKVNFFLMQARNNLSACLPMDLKEVLLQVANFIELRQH